VPPYLTEKKKTPFWCMPREFCSLPSFKGNYKNLVNRWKGNVQLHSPATFHIYLKRGKLRGIFEDYSLRHRLIKSL
jgi:hypothetical protein